MTMTRKEFYDKLYTSPVVPAPVEEVMDVVKKDE